jgi:hypothetical protein
MSQFETPDGSKKYQCFCCGQQFLDVYEFRQHVLDEHEEGREYVVCPLTRCGFPVRDLLLHFKAIHPSENPKLIKGQTRALIWKDFSPKGKGKTRKPQPKSGSYTSTKTGKTFHFRSSWEEKVYEFLDADEEVSSYEAEPFQIDYIHKGILRKYNPDLFVSFVDGHKELWEIKPSDQTHYEQNQNKWHAAKEACKIRGWKFVVITEQGIGQLKNKIRNQHLLD